MLKDPRKAKTLLKEKSALLQESESYLFSKKFRSHIIEIERSKKQSLEFFKGSNEKNTPFRKGPLHSKIRQSRPNKNIRFQNSTRASSVMQVQHQMVNTSFTIKEEVPVTSNSELFLLIKIAILEHVRPIIRTLFTKSIPNLPLVRKLVPYFIIAWEKITQGQEILSIVKGDEIPFVSLPNTPKNTKLDKNVKRTILISGTGSFGNVEERSYPKSSTQTRAISEQPLPCRKKGWSESPSDKFEKSQKIYFLRAFENGRSALSEIPSRTGRFAIQDRSQGGIFFSFSQQKLCKI